MKPSKVTTAELGKIVSDYLHTSGSHLRPLSASERHAFETHYEVTDGARGATVPSYWLGPRVEAEKRRAKEEADAARRRARAAAEKVAIIKPGKRPRTYLNRILQSCGLPPMHGSNDEHY